MRSPRTPLSPRDLTVRLNISGQIFQCSMHTLAAEDGSYFSSLVSFQAMANGFHCQSSQKNHHLQPPPQNQYGGSCSSSGHSNGVQEFFIDRDPTYFHLILNHLRGYDIANSIERLRDDERDLLAQDVRFYNIHSMFRYFPLMSCTKKFVVALGGQVKVFDARTGRCLHSMDAHRVGVNDVRSPSCILQLSDQHFVTSYKNEMKLWDSFTGACQCSWYDQSDDITNLYALNSTLFASLSRNHELKVYSLQTRQCLYSLVNILGIVVLSDELFLSQMPNGFIHVRRSANNEFVRTISDAQVSSCIVSLDDCRFASGSSHSVKIWNAMSGALEGQISDANSCFDDMTRITNNLVATKHNQVVHLWNFKTLTREYATRSYSCPGLSQIVQLTDNIFVSVGCSATNALSSLYIWDIAHGKCSLPHINKGGFSFKDIVRLSNGGFVIVCTKDDNTVRIGVWNPSSDIMYTSEVLFEKTDHPSAHKISIISL